MGRWVAGQDGKAGFESELQRQGTAGGDGDRGAPRVTPCLCAEESLPVPASPRALPGCTASATAAPETRTCLPGGHRAEQGQSPGWAAGARAVSTHSMPCEGSLHLGLELLWSSSFSSAVCGAGAPGALARLWAELLGPSAGSRPPPSRARGDCKPSTQMPPTATALDMERVTNKEKEATKRKTARSNKKKKRAGNSYRIPQRPT